MLRRYAWGVLLANLGVIVWGAFVRATGSGAGCGSHWPTCNGDVVPRAQSLETAIELTHRLTSGIAFLMVLALMIAALRARPTGHPMRRAAVLSFVFMVLEAGIGAGIVLLEYVADNQSVARAYWMAAHLTNTFLLVASLTLTAWWSSPEARGLRLRGRAHLAGPIGAALVGTILIGVTGAITALGDTLFPAGSLAAGVAQDFEATAHFLVRLRIWHPVAAMVMAVLLTLLAAYLGAKRPTRTTRRAAGWLVGLFVLQMVGGAINLLLLAPVWMQLVHLLMADLVWIVLVVLSASALEIDAPELDAPAAEPAVAAR